MEERFKPRKPNYLLAGFMLIGIDVVLTGATAVVLACRGETGAMLAVLAVGGLMLVMGALFCLVGYRLIKGSYVHSIAHESAGSWHLYLVALDALDYTWENVLVWADYLVRADMNRLVSVTVTEPDRRGAEWDCLDRVMQRGGRILKTPELQKDRESLSVDGVSRALGSLARVVFYSQSRQLFVITLEEDQRLIRTYIDALLTGTLDSLGQAACRPTPTGAPPPPKDFPMQKCARM